MLGSSFVALTKLYILTSIRIQRNSMSRYPTNNGNGRRVSCGPRCNCIAWADFTDLSKPPGSTHIIPSTYNGRQKIYSRTGLNKDHDDNFTRAWAAYGSDRGAIRKGAYKDSLTPGHVDGRSPYGVASFPGCEKTGWNFVNYPPGRPNVSSACVYITDPAGNKWFTLWCKNVRAMRAAGKSPLYVVTSKSGYGGNGLGRAQTREVTSSLSCANTVKRHFGTRMLHCKIVSH
jgi:hypothetical protein